MANRILLVTHVTPKQTEYEIYFDHASISLSGSGGIIRNGEDYASFVSVNSSIIDYDMVYELTTHAILALEKAGFSCTDIK